MYGPGQSVKVTKIERGKWMQ